jgi:hypothetical protein
MEDEPELFDEPRRIVGVTFGYSDAVYDYFVTFPIEVGQRAYVETKRGETKVRVVEFKETSDVARAYLLRPVIEETKEEENDE